MRHVICLVFIFFLLASFAYASTCTPPSGSCNPTAYCQCVEQNANRNPGTPEMACGPVYGPCSGVMACCGGMCTDTSINPLNCGKCGHSCTGGTACCGGACCGKNEGCCLYNGRTGDILGTATCVNLLPSGLAAGEMGNIWNCGTCGTICPSGPANSTITCTNGQCGFVCDSGYTDCGGQCVQCPGGASCSGTSCQCPKGETVCGASPGNPGICKNLQNDSKNCGKCGDVCTAPQNGTSTCVSGKCRIVCNSGYTNCGGVCTNLQADPKNCGKCGDVCKAPNNATASCPGGKCGWGCNKGYMNCGGDCVQCPLGGQCKGTKCGGCPSGETNCGGVCTNLQTDSNNCGVCATTCASGTQCVGGHCTPIGGGGTLTGCTNNPVDCEANGQYCYSNCSSCQAANGSLYTACNGFTWACICK